MNAPRRELLLAALTFPGEYMIKAFGPGGGDFRERVVASARRVLAEEHVEVRERATQSGARICVTLNLRVTCVEEVEEVYGHLYQVEDLMLIL